MEATPSNELLNPNPNRGSVKESKRVARRRLLSTTSSAPHVHRGAIKQAKRVARRRWQSGTVNMAAQDGGMPVAQLDEEINRDAVYDSLEASQENYNAGSTATFDSGNVASADSHDREQLSTKKKLHFLHPNLQQQHAEAQQAVLSSNDSDPGTFTEFVHEEDQDDTFHQDATESSFTSRPHASSGISHSHLLAVASPVDEEDLGYDLASARPVDLERREKALRQIKFQARVLLMVVAASLAIALGVFLSRALQSGNRESALTDQQDDRPNSSGPPAELSPRDKLLSVLPDSTKASIKDDSLSPQSEAFEWMLEDSKVQSYPSDRLIQRFALAVLYFTTNSADGDAGWDERGEWLSHTTHECDWMPPLHPYGQTYYNQLVDLPEIVCEDESIESTTHTRVFKHLVLFSNNLKRSIPDELYLLTGELATYYPRITIFGASFHSFLFVAFLHSPS